MFGKSKEAKIPEIEPEKSSGVLSAEKLEYYQEHQELIDEIRREIAKKLIKDNEKKFDIRERNSFLAEVGYDEEELAEEILGNVVSIKKFIEEYRVKETKKFVKQEVFPFIDGRINETSKNGWETMLDIYYREVLPERKRKEAGPGISYGKGGFGSEKEARDYLFIQKVVASDAFDKLGGGWVEEGNNLKKVFERE